MRYMFLFAVLLSGCAVAPAVTPLGNDRYAAGADSHELDAARSEAMKRANAYCASSGKTVSPQSVSDQSAGTVYRANVVFTCT